MVSNTILAVPYYNYSIMATKPCLLIKAPILALLGPKAQSKAMTHVANCAAAMPTGMGLAASCGGFAA